MSKYLVSPGMFGKNRIHLLAGSPSAGKSTLIAQLIQCFLDPTKKFLGDLEFEQLQPEEIGLIFSDRPKEDNLVWLENLEVKIPYYSLPDDKEGRKFLTTADRPGFLSGIALFQYCMLQLKRAKEQINKESKLKLVIVDVFTNCFIGGNIHDQTTVHKHMVNLIGECQEQDITILGTAYGSKQKSGAQDRYVRLIDRIIGAATLRGCATDLLYLASKEETGEGGYQEFHWVSRHEKPRAFALERNEDNIFQIKDGVNLENSMSSHNDYETNPHNLTPGQEKLIPFIPINQEFSKAEIVLIATNNSVMSPASVTTALKRYSELGIIVKLEHGKYLRKAES